MRVLWLGALHSDQALRTRKAPNPAAAKWTRGLLGGLRANGVEVFGLTHSYEQAWPKGQFLPGCEEDFDPSISLDWCKYINIKGCVRNGTLTACYKRKIRRIIDKHGIDLVVCYNILEYPYHVRAMRVATSLGVPCFPFILDGDDPRRDQWRWIIEGTRDAKGIVFLSDWMVKNYPGSLPVLHLDGGCSAWFGNEALRKREKNLLVYSGTLDHWRGLDLLTDVVRSLSDSEAEIIICGKNDKDELQKRLGVNRRIEVRGFVTEEELHEISLRASAFINTRDPKNEDNVLNFPSKIPNYLAYGKPIVSTWLPSMSDEYRNYIEVVESDDAEEYSKRVKSVLEWDQQRAEEHMLLIKTWFCENKLWTAQARRLVSWFVHTAGIR